MSLVIFFFQAEDGIRDHCVTGVQTCALPISFDTAVAIARRLGAGKLVMGQLWSFGDTLRLTAGLYDVARGGTPVREIKIGRASCRERVEILVGDGTLKKKEDVTIDQ